MDKTARKSFLKRVLGRGGHHHGVSNPAAVAPFEYPHPHSSALTQRHLRDAKLYATRHDMVADLKIAPGGVIAEIGVAYGDFSKYLLDTFKPKKFVAFDVF